LLLAAIAALAQAGCAADRCGRPPAVTPGELSALRAAQVTVRGGEFHNTCHEINAPFPPKSSPKTGLFQICVHPRGFVYDVTVQRSTGEPELDAFLVDAMRTWRYEPVVRGGSPVPFCHTMGYRHALEPPP
jgi:TonB family protein